MKYTVERIDKAKDYLKRDIWIKHDITEQVVMPILDVQRLDRALDTSSVVLFNNEPSAIKPFTRFIIRVEKDGENENIYRLVHDDSVQLISRGDIKQYRHELSLIEPTKWLERFVIDNTTITNILAFLYTDNPVITKPAIANVGKLSNDGYLDGVKIIDRNYIGTSKFAKKYTVNSAINTTVDYYVRCAYTIQGDSFYQTANLPLVSKRIVKPNGGYIDITDQDIYTPTVAGNYKMQYIYQLEVNVSLFVKTYINATIEWDIVASEEPVTEPKKPTRYSIREVIQLILSKIAYGTTAPRLQLDFPVFQLDSALDWLDNVEAPEFTFTQNTLFGILEQIGNYIHAIPRLIPFGVDNDDYSNWNIITYDFLGQEKTNNLDNYDLIASNQSYRGDNYTTAFVTDVQNSFQTNRADYISLVEPFDNGYISTRTEDGNFEISNDNALIKTSRPIQRIVSLECGVWLPTPQGETKFFNVDISKFIKEQTDYNLLIDYALTEDALIKTKSCNIYYTRGSNIINGLAYYPPKRFNWEYLATNRAIQNIIVLSANVQYNLNLQLNTALSLFNLQDLAFRVKYIPYYNFKAMQYKPYVDANSGNNTLFYNQQNAQTVDIESLGENIRGALMMTANKEFEVTGYNNGVNEMQVGEVLEPVNSYNEVSRFYAYQINREFIDTNTIKETIVFSKNFNKWNDYIAIQKNYREWEISNRECLETNPIANQFCVISDKNDCESFDLTQRRALYAELLQQRGFINNAFVEQLKQSLGASAQSPIKPIRWVFAKTQSFNEVTQETETKTFVLPCACFGFGNSLVLNFATQDNYSAGTTATPSKEVTGFTYSLESYIEYSDKLGNIDKIWLAFGADSAVTNFNADVLNNSKQLYSLTQENWQHTNTVVDYYRASSNYPDNSLYPFLIHKDSRQQLNFTAQLNFVTDTKKIWISPKLVQKLTTIGAEYAENSVKWCYFKKTPNLFLDKIDISDIILNTDINITDYLIDDIQVENNTIMIKPVFEDIIKPCVGVGLVTVNKQTNIIDNASSLLVYYNQEFKKGDTPNPIYLKLRSRV